ncbi:hypothetical protein HYV83_00770 [Candidatus Woesearchaeota archaeon]|nr:hypothetical protein [Candidatus Woesearchaeota archaeon]
MGAKNLNKAQRSRQKAALRQQLPGLNYFLSHAGIKEASNLLIMAENEETLKHYQSAIGYYQQTLSTLTTAEKELPLLGSLEELVGIVKDAIERAEEGLRDSRAKLKLAEYAKVYLMP